MTVISVQQFLDVTPFSVDLPAVCGVQLPPMVPVPPPPPVFPPAGVVDVGAGTDGAVVVGRLK